VLKLRADAEMAEPPVAELMKVRGQAGQNDGRFAAARGTQERRQATPTNGLNQSRDGYVTAKK
jgi:hypothetical protein